jgi:hypothetical protein
MPDFTVTPNEEPSIPRDGLHFWFDALYQSNRTNDQISLDRSGNYPGNFTFSNQVTVDSIWQSIKFDGSDFINLPINVSNVSQATFIFWGERRITTGLGSSGFFSNRTATSTNRFSINFTSTSGTVADGRIYYDWNVTNTPWNSGLSLPNYGTFMLAISLNSTGATISVVEGLTGTKRTFRRVESHSSITITQSAIGVSFLSSLQYSQDYFNSFLFYTRALSDAEITRVYNSTKKNIPSFSSQTAYISALFRGNSTDSKAAACDTNAKNVTAYNLFSSVPWENIGTGSIFWVNQLGLLPLGFTFASNQNVTPNIYIKCNRDTGEVQEWGPC